MRWQQRRSVLLLWVQLLRFSLHRLCGGDVLHCLEWLQQHAAPSLQQAPNFTQACCDYLEVLQEFSSCHMTLAVLPPKCARAQRCAQLTASHFCEPARSALLR